MTTKPFARTLMTPEQTATDAGLRRVLASAHEDLTASLPDGLYKERALMAVEEAALWATKALTHA